MRGSLFMSKKIEYKEGQVLNGCVYLHDVAAKPQPSGQIKRRARFRCKCDTEFETTIDGVKSGRTNSCGCWNIESSIKAATIHGLRYDRIYSVWKNIRVRCFNSNNKQYKYYGARGITICDEWNDFKVFYDYVTGLPDYGKEGYTLDRIDNDKNYESGNMRWATQHIQTANRRMNKTNKSGFAGVFKRGDNRFIVSITVNYNRHNLGTYSTAEEGAKVRDQYIIDNRLKEYPLSGL